MVTRDKHFRYILGNVFWDVVWFILQAIFLYCTSYVFNYQHLQVVFTFRYVGLNTHRDF